MDRGQLSLASEGSGTVGPDAHPTGDEKDDEAQLGIIARQMSRDKQGNASGPPFTRLPIKVIEHILYSVDADSFASLALLNRQWRQASESSRLYAHHLSQCLSSSAGNEVISQPEGSDDLVTLKRKFMTEIKRNTFAVYLRPRRTLIKLMSTSMSSSTAFPQGEAFRFSFSTNGRILLCLSSSRIVVLDVASEPAAVLHELKTYRRPLGAAIAEDGKLLAVVSSRHQVNIYRLSDREVEHVQVIALTGVPRTLALSPTGSVLALAYDDSIEMHALGGRNGPSESRSVRCAGMESLVFSSDGVMLLGSSTDGEHKSLVTVTAPFNTESGIESSPEDAQVRMWTTQVLIPEVIAGYSHVCLVPAQADNGDGWAVGYDCDLAAFRTVNVNNGKTGATYFATPNAGAGQREARPRTTPTIDSQGQSLAAAFEDCGLWLYGISRKLDVLPNVTTPVKAHHRTVDFGLVLDWVMPAAQPTYSTRDCSDRLRRTLQGTGFILNGHQVSDMQGISAAQWVSSPSAVAAGHGQGQRRLVAVAPGGVSPPTLGDEDVPIDGGRVLCLDFERSPVDGVSRELVIEVGEAEPKILTEQNTSLDTEVELERRRTVLHRPGVVAQRRSLPISQAGMDHLPDEGCQTRLHKDHRNSSYPNDALNGAQNSSRHGENSHLIDSPYDNAQPRSRDTLQRAATAAAASRSRYNARLRNPSRFEQQIPHESDPENWVPPPPPYESEPDGPLPDYLRRSLLLPGHMRAVPGGNVGDANIRRAQTLQFESRTHDVITRTQQRLDITTTSRAEVQPADGSRRHAVFTPYSLASQPNGHSTGQTAQDDIGNTGYGHSQHQGGEYTTGVFNSQTSHIVSPTDGSLVRDFAENDLYDGDAGAAAGTSTAVYQEAGIYRQYSISSPDILTQSSMQQNLQQGAAQNVHSPWEPCDSRRPLSRGIIQPRFGAAGRGLDSTMVPSPSAAPAAASASASGVMLQTRRAATDPPTLAALPQQQNAAATPNNEEWRRRIEEWNEQTIHERNHRRARLRCVLM